MTTKRVRCVSDRNAISVFVFGRVLRVSLGQMIADDQKAILALLQIGVWGQEDVLEIEWHCTSDNTISNPCDLSLPFPNLKTLTLETFYASDLPYDIAPLAKLRNLTDLDIYNFECKSPAPLAELTKLTRLLIDFNTKTDPKWESLKHLSACSSLKILSIGAVGTTSPLSLPHLPHLHTFSALRYRGGGKNDLVTLHALKSLRILYLYSYIGSDTNLKPLTQLRSLEVARVPSLLGIGELVNLLYLQCKAPSLNLSPLSNLVHLRFLRVGGKWTGDLQPLRACRDLIGVDVSEQHASDQDLAILAGLPKLDPELTLTDRLKAKYPYLDEWLEIEQRFYTKFAEDEEAMVEKSGFVC